MELKVWVEGIQRVVCGVCERTTCQDVVYALAHATGKTGRFTLIERWRNNERLLAPHEHPLKVLMKWGEYASDVHFILQRTALDPSSSNGNKQSVTTPNNKTGRPSVQSNKNPVDPLHGFTPPAQITAPTASIASTATISPSKDLKKSLTFSGGRPDNGLVRGSPKKIEQIDKGSNGRGDAWIDTKSYHAKSPPHSPMPANDANQLVYPRYEPPYGRAHPNVNGAVSPVDHAQQDHVRFPPPYRNPPPPSGTTPTKQNQPPPYREPPRPPSAGLSPYRSSPAPSKNGTPVQRPPSAVQTSPAESGFDSRDDQSRRSRRHLRLDVSDGGRARTPSPPSDPLQAQLIQQVNRQRGALDEQQERLVRLEQDLAEWEERLRRRLDEERQALNRELTQLEERCRTQESQLSDLPDVEDEWDRVCGEGRELAEELAKWRADVTLLDSQLDQCQPSVRSLRADLAEAEERLTAELEAELNRVKSELEEAGQEERRLLDEDRSLTDELADSDAKVRALRSQMDQLTQEIKQANLQSLSIAPVDDLKVHLEGTHKPGHSRRMLGSPRQLENPVPTNKNPHGVWV